MRAQRVDEVIPIRSRDNRRFARDISHRGDEIQQEVIRQRERIFERIPDQREITMVISERISRRKDHDGINGRLIPVDRMLSHVSGYLSWIQLWVLFSRAGPSWFINKKNACGGSVGR